MTQLLLHAAAVLALCTPPVPTAVAIRPAAADTAGVLAAQRAWWCAFILADTATLRGRSTATVSLTLSSGRTFGLGALLAEAASQTRGGELVVTWAEEAVRFPVPTVAVVTSRVTESVGAASGVYRFVTVLERRGAVWRATAAQSTRELAFTPRTYGAPAAGLADYAGSYRTPRGLALRVVVRDSALGLIEPSGKEIRMEPVGPGLFEFPELSPSNGLVRLLFTRDATGRVTAFSQLLSGAVNTFPRTP